MGTESGSLSGETPEEICDDVHHLSGQVCLHAHSNGSRDQDWDAKRGGEVEQKGWSGELVPEDAVADFDVSASVASCEYDHHSLLHAEQLLEESAFLDLEGCHVEGLGPFSEGESPGLEMCLHCFDGHRNEFIRGLECFLC